MIRNGGVVRMSGLALMLGQALMVSAMPVGGAVAQTVVKGSTIQQMIGLTPDAIAATTRGIRPAGPAGQPARALAIDLTVRFATGSAVLSPQAVEQLNELGAALKGAPASYRFRIEGHTDTTGTREGNLALSLRRAEAVVAFLTERHGIAAIQLQPVGRGQEHLLVATPDQVDEPANRRVTVVNLGG